MNYTLLDLTTQIRDIGRAVVMFHTATADPTDRVPQKWNGVRDLFLKHLGDTEGEIGVTMNEEFVHRTLPELTGPAKHGSWVSGEDPVISIPLYYADPALRAICTPTGNASGGYQRRRPVREVTLVLFPEELFYDPTDDAYEVLSATTGAGGPVTTFTVGGTALTTRQTQLLGLSMWFWRGYFTKPGPVFRHEEAGKALQTVNFQVMHTDLALSAIPDGERLYTLGDPEAAAINIEPTTTP